MKYSIREMLLVIFIVAALLAWFIDHRAAVGRERAWQQAFQKALETLSFYVQRDPVTVESPAGPWRVHCTVAVEPPEGAE